MFVTSPYLEQDLPNTVSKLQADRKEKIIAVKKFKGMIAQRNEESLHIQVKCLYYIISTLKCINCSPTLMPYISIEQVPTDDISTSSSKSQQSTSQLATTGMSQDVSQY